MIKLMIVDDHAMFREGLRQQFAQCLDIQIVAEAGSIEQMKMLLEQSRPDVIILDIKLPDGSGASQISYIKKKLPKCRVIILTMYDNARYAIHAFEQYADGFVVKGSPFSELLTAVHNVIVGKRFVSQATGNHLADHIHADGRKPYRLDSLSKREFEVLTHLSLGLRSNEIAAKLDLSEKTVSTYKVRLMQKLNLTSLSDLIRFAIDNGISD